MEQTQEEILTDGFYGRETTADSGINEEEQSDDAPESTEVDEETTEEVDEDGTDSEPEQIEEKPKKQSSHEKLLAQRNEARREADELRKQISERYDTWSIKDISDISEQNAREVYRQERFLESKWVGEDADTILAIAKKSNLSVEDAYLLHVARHNPKALLDSQTIAKSESKKLGVSWIANRSVNKSKDPYDKASLDAVNKQYAAEINGMY